MAGSRGRIHKAANSTPRIDRNIAVRISVWTLAFCAFITAIFMAWFGLKRLFFTSNPHFVLRQVNVTVQKGSFDKNQLKDRLNLTPGEDNLFAISPLKLRTKLLRDPIIEQVEVKRVLPDTLNVDVVSRTPIAQLLKAGGKTVDSAGFVMPSAKSEETRSLPVIRGIRNVTDAGIGTALEDDMLHDAIDLLTLISEYPMANRMFDVSSIVCDNRNRQLTVLLRGNPTFCIRPSAQLHVPAGATMELALLKALDALEVRSLARQYSSNIDCTFKRVYIMP